MSAQSQRFALIAGVMLITLATWYGVLAGSFQYDDYPNVIQDSATSDPGVFWHRLTSGFRPLLRASYFLDHLVGDARARVPGNKSDAASGRSPRGFPACTAPARWRLRRSRGCHHLRCPACARRSHRIRLGAFFRPDGDAPAPGPVVLRTIPSVADGRNGAVALCPSGKGNRAGIPVTARGVGDHPPQCAPRSGQTTAALSCCRRGLQPRGTRSTSHSGPACLLPCPALSAAEPGLERHRCARNPFSMAAALGPFD